MKMAKHILLLLLHLSVYVRARLVNSEADVPETLHRMLNNEAIRNNLDSFSMTRRETYTQTPEYGHTPADLPNKRVDTVHEKEIDPGDVSNTKVTYNVTDPKLHKEYLHRRLNNDDIKSSLTNFEINTPVVNTFKPKFRESKKKPIIVSKSGDVKTFFSDLISSKSKSISINNRYKRSVLDEKHLPEINDFSNVQQLINREEKIKELLKSDLMNEGKEEGVEYLPEIRKALSKQQKIIQAIKEITDPLNSSYDEDHFLDILESIEKKRSTKPSTTAIMVDQIDVRQALYQDPLVRRILKLAQRKNILNKA